jgi:peptidyl-prolyl isomerase G (cyclophilin G)
MAVAQKGDGGIYVFMEVEISSVNIGRMIFKLYNESCPKTVENFRSLCTGERGTGLTTKRPLHFQGAKFHRIIPGFMCQGGDFELGDGRGGESVYGGKFNDESGGLAIKHTKRGLLSMANCGPDTNGSQFFILFKPAQHLNGKHCVFGEMVDGDATLDAIEGVKTQSDDKPIAPILVARCGQMERRVIGMRKIVKKRKKGSDDSSGGDASGSSDSSSGDKKKKKKKDKEKGNKKKKDKKSKK